MNKETLDECINILRKEWYRLNNMSTEFMDSRGVAIHVGQKTGVLLCINKLAEKRDGLDQV